MTSIPTVPYLEALLLLRAHAHPWYSQAVAQRLYINDKTALSLLTELCQSGMAERCTDTNPPTWRYQPASAQMRATIDLLADLYARHLVEVTILIHSKLDRKAQQFADAFKWRKDT